MTEIANVYGQALYDLAKDEGLTDKVLDQITRRENFKWSIFSLILYTVFLFLAVYIPANILACPDIADILFEVCKLANVNKIDLEQVLYEKNDRFCKENIGN